MYRWGLLYACLGLYFYMFILRTEKMIICSFSIYKKCCFFYLENGKTGMASFVDLGSLIFKEGLQDAYAVRPVLNVLLLFNICQCGDITHHWKFVGERGDAAILRTRRPVVEWSSRRTCLLAVGQPHRLVRRKYVPQEAENWPRQLREGQRGSESMASG